MQQRPSLSTLPEKTRYEERSTALFGIGTTLYVSLKVADKLGLVCV